MCLAALYTERYRKRAGWKLLCSLDDGSFTTGQCGAREVTLELNKWVKDPNNYINFYPRYPHGFHIFTSKREARKVLTQHRKDYTNLVLVKVRFRKQVAYGYVGWCFRKKPKFNTQVVVAREVMILGEI